MEQGTKEFKGLCVARAEDRWTAPNLGGGGGGVESVFME